MIFTKLTENIHALDPQILSVCLTHTVQRAWMSCFFCKTACYQLWCCIVAFPWKTGTVDFIQDQQLLRSCQWHLFGTNLLKKKMHKDNQLMYCKGCQLTHCQFTTFKLNNNLFRTWKWWSVKPAFKDSEDHVLLAVFMLVEWFSSCVLVLASK